MPTIRTVAPTYEPITLTLAKLHCKVEHTDDDTLFTQVIIPGARAQLEQILRRSVMLQTWRKTINSFHANCIKLPWPNLLTVSAVQYRDINGNWQTLDASGYAVDVDSVPGSIRPVYGTSWPGTYGDDGSVKITYTAGYASGNEAAQQAAVPANIKHWMLLRCGTAYEHREELVAGVNVNALPNRFHDALLDSETVYGSAGQGERE